MARPVPSKVNIQPGPGPDTAMLFTPFGCIHQPPSVPPFLPMQSLFPNDVAKVTSPDESFLLSTDSYLYEFKWLMVCLREENVCIT